MNATEAAALSEQNEPVAEVTRFVKVIDESIRAAASVGNRHIFPFDIITIIAYMVSPCETEKQAIREYYVSRGFIWDYCDSARIRW